VIDLGFGEGKFLKLLLKERYISKIEGVGSPTLMATFILDD